MKFYILDIKAIEASYSVFSNYATLPHSHTSTQKKLQRIDVKENEKYKQLRDCAEEILAKQPEYIDQFKTSTIPGILTFCDIAPDVHSYTSAIRFIPFVQDSIDDIEVELADDEAYKMIVPLILYVMMFNRQIEYFNCYYADVYTGNISVIIDSSKLDEVNVLCIYFGYELESQIDIADEVQAVGRPSLIELKYMLNNQKLK